MPPLVAIRLTALLWLGGSVVGLHAAPAPSRTAISIPSSIELSKPFGAPPGWRFSASQGPETTEMMGDVSTASPGVIRLCISRDGERTCAPPLDKLLAGGQKVAWFSLPHYLIDARIVHPRTDLPLLLIQVASLHSGDGDQRVATVALSYNHVKHAFEPVYEKLTGRNNNQEVRYVESGPLRGAIVSAEPTSDAPFGFWITVNAVGSRTRYRQVQRFRSATLYGDGNELAVIDSEMPNLMQRFSRGQAGFELPLPAQGCLKPRLIKRELWCLDRSSPH